MNCDQVQNKNLAIADVAAHACTIRIFAVDCSAGYGSAGNAGRENEGPSGKAGHEIA